MWPPACLDLTPEAQHWGPPSGSPASLPLSPAGWSAHNLLACPRNCLGSSVQGESFSFSFRGFCLCFTLVCSPLQLIFLWVSRPPTQKWFRPLPPPFISSWDKCYFLQFHILDLNISRDFTDIKSFYP